MTDLLNSFAAHFGYETLNALLIGVGWTFLSAGLIVAAGWLALRIIVRRAVTAMERMRFPDPTVRGVIALGLRWGILLITAYYVMIAIGVQATAILGVVTGSALAIGLAMQGTLANVASGIMLLVLRPISVGDYIQGGGYEGTVITVGIFYTTLDTLEKYRVSIPNSEMFGNPIVNLTRNPVLTARLLIGVAYDSDLDQVSDLLIAAAEGVPGVLRTPKPQVLIQDLADSAISLEVRFDTQRADHWPIFRKVRQAAKATLDAHGIEIPFPQTTVHYRPQPTSAPPPQP